jgi:hypothetical protein
MLRVEMTEQEWIAVMNMIALAPYRDAQPFIAKMSQQLTAQKETEAVMPPPSNGQGREKAKG